ncbi:hypothetical protein OG468_08605 [Streptomyces zaomyceticus]|uniref:hypothetical protein n=1 Tax=Streptomyces zaomyceticus TaxID=68286 RepID=UPI00324BEF0A
MPDTTALGQATAVIEKAWGQPIEVLEVLAVRHPCDDPLLRSAMHIRTALAITDNAVTVHQDRLHALTRPGYVPAFYELDRIVNSATTLRVALAERCVRAGDQARGRSVRSRLDRGPGPGDAPVPGRCRPLGARSTCPGPSARPACSYGRHRQPAPSPGPRR